MVKHSKKGLVSSTIRHQALSFAYLTQNVFLIFGIWGTNKNLDHIGNIEGPHVHIRTTDEGSTNVHWVSFQRKLCNRNLRKITSSVPNLLQWNFHARIENIKFGGAYDVPLSQSLFKNTMLTITSQEKGQKQNGSLFLFLNKLANFQVSSCLGTFQAPDRKRNKTTRWQTENEKLHTTFFEVSHQLWPKQSQLLDSAKCKSRV